MYGGSKNGELDGSFDMGNTPVWDFEVAPRDPVAVGCSFLNEKEKEGEAIWVWDLQKRKPITYLKGHTGVVYGIKMTPDGRQIVSASHDETLRVWDLASGCCVTALENPGAKLFPSVAITPDGKRVIASGKKHGLRIWDLERGTCMKTIYGKFDEVFCLATTPDGRRVVVGGWNPTIRVLDLASGKSVAALEGHTGSVHCIEFTADGKTVLSGSWDRALRVWDAKSCRCLSVYQAIAHINCTSPVDPRMNFVFGTESGELLFMRLHNVPGGLPVVTAVRLWRHAVADNPGRWDSEITVACPWCGQRVAVDGQLLDCIGTINQKTGLSSSQSPCLELPAAAWESPQLVSACPLCAQLLRFNPFVVDCREKHVCDCISR